MGFADSAEGEMAALVAAHERDKVVWEKLVKEEREDGELTLKVVYRIIPDRVSEDMRTQELADQYDARLQEVEKEHEATRKALKEALEDCDWLRTSLHQSHGDVDSAQNKTLQQSNYVSRLQSMAHR